MKNYLLYSAMFLLVLCLPFSGNEKEVRWLWEDLQWPPIVMMFMALLFIGIYLFRQERYNKTNVR